MFSMQPAIPKVIPGFRFMLQQQTTLTSLKRMLSLELVLMVVGMMKMLIGELYNDLVTITT